MKRFLGFTLVSGGGWLLDMLAYTWLTQALSTPAVAANLVSSFLGVSYVWLLALNRVFERGQYGLSGYLLVYWAYQALSISLYSLLISSLTNSLWLQDLSGNLIPAAVTAKILATPLNLLSNYAFMHWLTGSMRAPNGAQSN